MVGVVSSTYLFISFVTFVIFMMIHQASRTHSPAFPGHAIFEFVRTDIPMSISFKNHYYNVCQQIDNESVKQVYFSIGLRALNPKLILYQLFSSDSLLLLFLILSGLTFGFDFH